MVEYDVENNTIRYQLTNHLGSSIVSSGSISIQYKLNDKLDLTSSKGRDFAYNFIQYF